MVISQDPDDIKNLDALEAGPAMTDGNPGTFSQEAIEEGDDKIVVSTTKVIVEETPSKRKGKKDKKDKKAVSETKPGVVTTHKVKHGNKPAVLTTTLVPIQGTPKGYESNILDLFSAGFPGFNTVSEEDANPCTVTVDTIPEGNQITTITKVTSRETPESQLDGLPCTISTKTVKDGKKESLVTYLSCN